MGKYFSSGLIILLPILLTLMIVNYAVNFLTAPFLELTNNFLKEWILLPGPFLLFQSSHVITWSSKVLILLELSGFIMLIGLLGKLFFIDLFFRFSNFLLNNLPIINKVYQASQDVVSNLFSSTSKKFSFVVIAPFPNPESFCIGLVASDKVTLQKSKDDCEQLITVFIPGTPNPTVGYLLLFKKEQLIFVNMKVEEAMKFIVSSGIVMPECQISKTEHSS